MALPLYYTSVAEFKAKVPAILQAKGTNDANGTTVNDDYIEEFLREAESIIDSYLGVRYFTPVKAPDGTVPPVIKNHVLTLGKYELFKRRNLVNQALQEQFAFTMQWLRDVSTGKASLAVYEADGTRDDSREIIFAQGSQADQVITTIFD